VVFILPIGLYQIIAHSMTLNIKEEESAKYFFEAKAIAFAIFVGTVLVFFVPLWLWKLTVCHLHTHSPNKRPDLREFRARSV
jgi:cell division protein FtsW (lipid II flippase)